MDNSYSSNIDVQKDKLIQGIPEINIIKSCSLGDGIIKLNQNLGNTEIDESITWFIPASGSGSRMFQFLFDFLEDGDLNKKEIQQFISSIKEFAFYHKLEGEVRKNIEEENLPIRELIQYILLENGMNFSKMPKGLVPFHIKKEDVSNPFQESIIQGVKLPMDIINFHFTIQKEFENDIQESISEIAIENLPKIEFSEQYKKTDSVAFDEEFNPVMISENEYLKRPSGHGALLTNLNRVEADYVLIRNIDNIQHTTKSQPSLDVWSNLLALSMQIKKELHEVWHNPSKELLIQINTKYQLVDSEYLESISNSAEILELINRPLRICGMVKNSGQPGGGPFWVKSNGKLTKQIIEKAQISEDTYQQQILENSTHFNPVMIVASVKDFEGKKYNLSDFVDDETYFVVTKNHKGKSIQYLENPGLWNGSMAHWNSVFVEIPSEVFSPVKTILDLLDERHLE
jgi:hypothetical protein